MSIIFDFAQIKRCMFRRTAIREFAMEGQSSKYLMAWLLIVTIELHFLAAGCRLLEHEITSRTVVEASVYCEICHEGRSIKNIALPGVVAFLECNGARVSGSSTTDSSGK
ncbi:uncharacterized protein LOC112350226 [Selaginella moellendorffii]|uniref:uncharacterized protein LOC112350226 n=1 Tax=Selaginella moellendorffii TaxID=88036 RepID=UPI000D1CA914|nr:uncharacterized protein LOC112350226 [Selaginella moellendorffii]|eukprot:XP_024541827.1 uncharacterized protein LOC112350226 [Selaginella moellendorffii]